MEAVTLTIRARPTQEATWAQDPSTALIYEPYDGSDRKWQTRPESESEMYARGHGGYVEVADIGTYGDKGWKDQVIEESCDL